MEVQAPKHLPDIQFTSTKQQRMEQKQYAEMEPKTKRIRDRLAKRLDAQEKKMTQKALQDTKVKIHHWIARHQSERKVIQKETFSLFSGGKSVAEASSKIQAIRQQIEQRFAEDASHIPHNLKGRVTKSS